MLCFPGPQRVLLTHPLSSKMGTNRKKACQARWPQAECVSGPVATGYLVGGDMRVGREGQHAHGLADLIQLAPFSLTEVFPGVSRKQYLGSKFALSSLRT